MAERQRVLIRQGSGIDPPLVMRPAELAVTLADGGLWYGDRDGAPTRVGVAFDPVAFGDWFDHLPTTPPLAAGEWWNNGGTLART